LYSCLNCSYQSQRPFNSFNGRDSTKILGGFEQKAVTPKLKIPQRMGAENLVRVQLKGSSWLRVRRFWKYGSEPCVFERKFLFPNLSQKSQFTSDSVQLVYNTISSLLEFSQTHHTSSIQSVGRRASLIEVVSNIRPISAIEYARFVP